MHTEQVWHDFSDALWRFIRARVPSDADADDVMQDVFVKVLSNRDRLREQERLAGWVFRIASNAVADHHRGAKPLPDLAATVPVDDPAAAEELAGCVRPFVGMLPEPYREALQLTELDGLTQAEAAARVGISVSGMKSRVQRGRTQLRGLFEACCEVSLDARNGIVDYTPRCEGSCD